MNRAAVYHRPESEMAYLYDQDTIHLRLKVAKDDVSQVEVIKGDPYLIDDQKWYRKSEKMFLRASTEDADYYQIAINAEFRRLSYIFRVIFNSGESMLYTEHGLVEDDDSNLCSAGHYFRFPFMHAADQFYAPQWVKDTVWYIILPDRFANGDASNDPKVTQIWDSLRTPHYSDFYGGDLQGIIDKLDYLEELGINGIYLCPVFKAATHHKYDTIDYFEIDPHFGDKVLFKELVEDCHRRGIKVMMDAVFNHIGTASYQWQDVLRNGENSRFKDWFHINQFPVSFTNNCVDGQWNTRATYHMFAFVEHMPKMNTANPEVRDYLLSVARYWIEHFDIDGWRLDVANEIDHAFWREFRKVCDSVKKDFYIMGEIWHSSQPWLEGDQFHAVINYAFTDCILSHYAYGNISLSQMIGDINRQSMLYREQTNQVMFNLFAAHDMPRLIDLCGNNKTLMRFVLAFMYLQKGSPAIFYGDELGLLGGQDPDCRRCMPWEKELQDTSLHDFYRDLISLRKEYSQLISLGELKITQLDDQKDLLNFEITLEDQSISAIFNAGEDYSCHISNALLANEYDGHNLRKHGFIIYA
ncbi:glycoside hydrolase family 13 protein [Streptococcus ictaluri]|uniref:Intracellular maltogenic amylase n=1 Tax=Streptococcus ictaluri 707-05 TaxID=764299 RepID=G5K679_9STRE|nr:glycoside hydrolase family 13 protein [Streptococcus ictaluri]EHI68697.1 intracellular maltogenic amylase [Streptococcus ictaluri 707-05]